MKNEIRDNICSPLWWEAVVIAWNNNSERGKLSKLGYSKFEVTNSDIPATVIFWDDKGMASIALSDDNGRIATFSASMKNWKAFINGDFNAVKGVLLGKIKFKGSALSILPYTDGFTLLAKTAKLFTSQASASARLQ